MTNTTWVLKGTEYGSCNCDYGCPCQFMGKPSSPDGDCRYVTFNYIDEGHYGDVNLSGVRFIWMGGWPGPIHEGNGTFQLVIGERASEEQREAIRRIVYNEDTDELLSHFSIYISLCTTIHEPIIASMDLEFDVESRTARGEAPGIVELNIEPIRNPVTGEPHRAQITLPEGFECTVIETASGTAKATGTVPLDMTNSFAGFAKLHMTDKGIIRD